jgi:diguanylate cyclase (GGDEF)-like protein
VENEGVPETRVILVGRTGLDAALRLDPSVDLVRVRTPLDALGELATPLDRATPQRAVVVLASDAQRSVAEVVDLPEGEGAPQRERVREYVQSLRQIDPGVRVVGVCGEGMLTDDDLFDAVLASDAEAEAVRSAMHPGPRLARETTSAPPSPATDLTPPESAAPVPRFATESVVGAAGIPTGSAGDVALIELMLQGKDILSSAVSAIRARTGDPGVEFIELAAKSARPSVGALVPVTSGEAILGYLVPTGTPTPQFASEAKWLGAWLRLRDQQTQLRQAAFTDPLTGAWNRRYFDRFLASAIDSAREHRWNVTVLVFDVDNFKSFNDAFGHEAGDEILRETVRLLSSVIRPSDRVCRIGGDEFAVIFHEPRGPRKPDSRHPTSVFDIAQRFQEKITNAQFPKLGMNAPGQLTISGGLATFPWDGNSARELLARADELALASKRQGKNVISIGPGALRADRER